MSDRSSTSIAPVDTAPIVADVGRARADMAVALEALGHRLSPAKLKARAKEKLVAKLEELKDRLNPVHIVQRKLGHRPPLGKRPAGVLAARVADDRSDRHPAVR
jgi:hypothetical protein